MRLVVYVFYYEVVLKFRNVINAIGIFVISLEEQSWTQMQPPNCITNPCVLHLPVPNHHLAVEK